MRAFALLRMTMAYGIIHKVLLRGPERPWRHGKRTGG